MPERSLNVPWTIPECSLNVPWIFPECSMKFDALWTNRVEYSDTMITKLFEGQTAMKSIPAVKTDASCCAQNIPWLFPECSLNVPWLFPDCSLIVLWLFSDCSLIVPWLFPDCSLIVPWLFTDCSLIVPWLFPDCSLNIPWIFCRFLAHLQLIIMMEALCDWTRSSTPGIRRLVLLTLVLGTHVCKFYSASTLVLF
jgi:hypothetical protein